MPKSRKASSKVTKKATHTQHRAPRRGSRCSDRQQALRFLILEGDSPRLVHDRLSIGTELCQSLKAFAPTGSSIDLVLASSATIPHELGKLNGPYDVVILIGHSNASVFALLNDNKPTWEKLAREWLAHFAPKTLIVIGCMAGNLPPMRALFRELTTLKDIYASPITITRKQALSFSLIAVYRLWEKELPQDDISVIQLMSYILTGGQLWNWRRDECLRSDAIDELGHSVTIEMLKKFRELW